MKKLIVIIVMLIAGNVSAQWEPDVRLTNAPETSHTSNNNARCIAISGNYIHTVWYDARDGNFEIYYKRSTDSGVTWGTDTRLTNNSASSEYPSIAVSGSNLNVVWHDNRDGINSEIYYKCSTDGGTTWGADTRLTNNTASSSAPSIAISGTLLHMVWHDTRDANLEIYYKRSTDGGTTWGADTRLTNNYAESSWASIVVYGSILHVIWQDERDGNLEIYYKSSTDGGTTWGADTRLTDNIAISWYPCIAVSGSIVHVVWYDERDGNFEIYYKCSTDGGTTWGADTRLTNNTSSSAVPSITVSGLVVHVVWTDFRDGNTEIYYKRSTDGGTTWGADTRLTNNTASSSGPSIIVSGSNVHIVWTDFRDGNYEIYYKRNPTGNLVKIQNIGTEVSSVYSLSQNFPNPFNPVTSVEFSVPKQAFVKISVFDIAGKEVDILVNENLQAGKYRTDWSASKYSSGIYFCTINSGDFRETIRMILLK